MINKVKILDTNKLFFSSDHHFGHKNIIKFQNRPFKDVQEQDNELVRLWNETVPPDGIVIYQGDFALKLKSEKLKWILESLNYEKMYLIIGNHEKDILKKYWAKKYFEIISQRIEFYIQDGNKMNVIVADHFPLLSWNRKYHGSYHTYGHVHNNDFIHPEKRTYNVCIDVNNYRPISYDDLMLKMNKNDNVRV